MRVCGLSVAVHAAKLEPVGLINGQTEQWIKLFCEQKQITVEALDALGARVAVRRGGRVELAFAGDRAEFLELIGNTRPPRFEFSTLTELLAHPYPQAEPLLGEPGAIFLAVGSLLMVYGADGSGKSTWTIDGIATWPPAITGSTSPSRVPSAFV
jgi:hypothetical protein